MDIVSYCLFDWYWYDTVIIKSAKKITWRNPMGMYRKPIEIDQNTEVSKYKYDMYIIMDIWGHSVVTSLWSHWNHEDSGIFFSHMAASFRLVTYCNLPRLVESIDKACWLLYRLLCKLWRIVVMWITEKTHGESIPRCWVKLHYGKNTVVCMDNRRKFRSETSDNMDSWKAEVRRVRREKIRRKKMQMREKVGKSRNTVFFQWFAAPEGRKVGSLKRRVRSQLARWEMKSCTPLWREAHFQVKMYKTHHSRTTFGSWDVEKVHAVVARSTFPSQNVQNTSVSDDFWKLRCRKSARRCGAKHILKSKCTKHTILGRLLEVEMSKKCRKSARSCGAKHISKSKV